MVGGPEDGRGIDCGGMAGVLEDGGCGWLYGSFVGGVVGALGDNGGGLDGGVAVGLKEGGDGLLLGGVAGGLDCDGGE